jgi:membrane-associated phospholipid phosphatase
MIKKDFDIEYSLKTFIITLGVCVVMIGLCYWFVDKPVVFFTHAHGFREYTILHWIQKIPNIIFPLVILAIIYLGYKFYKKSITYFDRFILRCIISLILITILKYPIKYFFARHWPSTFCNNLSLLKDGVYGFSFFNIGKAYEAFPSGNTANIFTIATITWFYYPRWRWLGILVVILSVIGVVGLYYHFVSDVIGGAFLGITMAIVTLSPAKKRVSRRAA